MTIEKKRIGHSTYIYDWSKNLLGQIKGPYRPGNVWKANLYKTTKAFDTAWNTEKLTPVQMGKVSQMGARMIAAMSFGDSGAIDSSLFTSNECLGYLYDTKKEATQAIEEAFKKA